LTAARSLVLLAALTLLLALVGLAALVGGLWFWSADSSSLATTLGQVAHWLPAGQSHHAAAAPPGRWRGPS